MAIDTPAKIAVLGAGPIGLEAALYGRYLGYDVEIFDRGGVAQNVADWGHVRLFSPFSMNSTPLALSALQAQDESYVPPPGDALLTGNQWRDQYLLPLSQTDLLVDHLRLNTRVLAVSRRDALKHELVGNEEREESPFRILVSDSHREWECFADVMIDATGVYGNANWIGAGGGPALNERANRDRIRYDLPDPAGRDRERYANKRVLVIGSGFSAATSIVSLVDLAAATTETRITWVTRPPIPATSLGPMCEISNDPLLERQRVAGTANRAVADHADILAHSPGTTIKSVAWDDVKRAFTVEFLGRHAGVGEFDEVIANVGYRPDNSVYAELQVHECYATNGPMRLAVRLAGASSADCLTQQPHGAESLVNPEPNFYILGAKSYGRNPSFLVSVGYQQIRELFALIGDRETLNLYPGLKSYPG